ncbi:uncharacterized protein [Blastocystis hominis]|uniref:AAA+ ATPase domain-containing protein n=1 Tax=Blastocystis hominis TaxID=12968 RepID=D8LZC9_BLAHO|nr:uncharacterized protein [Blastocystis hominis]CBK21168.2 unnamed protein product [Blastocystis hominis]|eukprot:XP_012895216.1 uncharacterized protein [Blastocystis hominis]
MSDTMEVESSPKETPKEETSPKALQEAEVDEMKKYMGPYVREIQEIEKKIKELESEVNKAVGAKESDTGLAPPSQWNLDQDSKRAKGKSYMIAQCVQAITTEKKEPAFVIQIPQFAKFVSGLDKNVSSVDIEVGKRVAVSQDHYTIAKSLDNAIDSSVSNMEIEEKPDVTYDDVGGCADALRELREVVETPLLHPERFTDLGIDPPKGVLLYGPPGTGKTLSARAVANRTEATFIRVLGSELVQKYVGEGARIVRELFQLARSKKACIIFFDEVDSIGGTRFDGDGDSGDTDVQNTMLELVNQLDGFDARGNIKVLMATNRPDTLDPALKRPGRLDRKVEFALPDLEGRTEIFKIHARPMTCERGIRFELLARLCPNTTGAEIRSVCTEAGMFAIRARRKAVTEDDFLKAIDKVIKGYQKFSSTSKYMVYNWNVCWKDEGRRGNGMTIFLEVIALRVV